MTMSIFAIAALAATQAVAPHAFIQPAASSAVNAPAAPVAVIIAPAAESVVRAGTEVPLVMSESITTNGKKLRVGQRLHLAVASDVRLGSSVVIPAGSLAEGEVTDVRNKGMWGKSGRIEARALSVRVGDRMIRLTGSFDDKGVTGTAGVVGAIVLLPIAGFFMTGTSANIPAGSGVKAFLDEDLRIAMPAPAPVAVQAALPVAVVAAAIPASAPAKPK